MAHTRGGADGREECCERGYYHLHRQLDDPLSLHTLIFFLTTNYTNFTNFTVTFIAQPIISLISAIRGF